MANDDIKSMKLYDQVDRILRDLAAIGIGEHDALSVEQLAPYDHFHYFGTEAVAQAVPAAGIGVGSRVLDIGSGLGGPARYLAQATGCRVTAVELQPDMNATAAALTRRCGLAGRIEHVEGDILAAPLAPAGFDAAVSWLALYHIPNRAALWPRLKAALRPDGRAHVEDFYVRRPLSEAERAVLEGQFFANTLADRDGYLAELAAGGFEAIAFDDMTEAWAGFTAERAAAFRARREAYCAVHGPEMFEALDAFYAMAAELFAAGNLGGVRLTARALP